MEEWKIIEDYPDYMISNMGRVKSLNYNRTGKEKILKPSKNNGYYYLNLCKNGKPQKYKVHQLVGKYFIPNPDNKPFIDHINTDRTDNRVENLRWVTAKENCNNKLSIDNYKKRTSKLWERKDYVIKNKVSHSIPILQFTKEGELVKKWLSAKSVEEEIGFYGSAIRECCKGNRKTAYGFIWRYYYKGIWNKQHIPQINKAA